MRNVDPSKVYRLFYPVVPVVVASCHGGVVSAMPVVSAISVSNNPSKVGFSSSPTHSTYRTVASSRAFSMSWLSNKFVKAVETLGAATGRGTKDKLSLAGLKHRSGKVLDVPVIEGASATLECSVSSIHNLGDHDFVVGDVKSAYAGSDFSEYWQFAGYAPILYAGSPDRFRVFSVG